MSSTAFWTGCNESPSYRDSARFCSVGIGFKNRLAQVFPFGEKSSTIRKNSTKPYLALLSHLHIESPKRSSWCTHVQASGSAIKKNFFHLLQLFTYFTNFRITSDTDCASVRWSTNGRKENDRPALYNLGRLAAFAAWFPGSRAGNMLPL